MPKREEHEEPKTDSEAEAAAEDETLSEDELENIAGGTGTGRYGYDGGAGDDGQDDGGSQGTGRYGHTTKRTGQSVGGLGRHAGVGRWANVGKLGRHR